MTILEYALKNGIRLRPLSDYPGVSSAVDEVGRQRFVEVCNCELETVVGLKAQRVLDALKFFLHVLEDVQLEEIIAIQTAAMSQIYVYMFG